MRLFNYKFAFSSFFILYAFLLNAQVADSPETVIHKFFIAMNEIDTSYLNHVLYKEATLATTMFDKSEKGVIKISKANKFAGAISKSLPGELDEQISNLRVEIDGSLANVWMDYSFYYKGQLSHCGVNNFTMAIIEDEWKIIALADTRRLDNCVFENEKVSINTLLNDWHLAATNADSTAYFDLMTNNSIFVGTDKTEVWTKSQFINFAAPYFAKGKAWDFKTVNRNVYSSDFKKLAWFDELLDTWMGPCRGSGIVVKQNDKWLVQHYVLSVTVPNEDIKEFIKISEK